MKKILAINECWSDNLGDVAIGETIRKYYEGKGFTVECIDFTKKIKKEIGDLVESSKENTDEIQEKVNWNIKVKERIKQILPFTSTFRWLMLNRQIFLSIKDNKYDRIIIGGGQLLLSNGYFPVALLLWFLVNRFFIKSKIYLFAVGTGNKIAKQDKFIYKYIFPKFDGIYIRDYESIDKLSELVDRDLLKWTPDIVYYYNKLMPENNIKKENLFLVQILEFETVKKYMEFNNEEAYMHFWKELIDRHRGDYRVQLCYNTLSDKRQTYKFNVYCNEHFGLTYEIIKTDDINSLTNALSRANVIMSGRMHGMILGVNYGCEIIPFEFSDKLKSFSNEVKTNFSLEHLQYKIDENLMEIISE